MIQIDVKEYARRLHSRAHEAVRLRHAIIEGGDWQPQPNMCHHNVSTWCQHKTDYKPVRGWLYFDLPGLNYVKFVAHSAVRTLQGGLFDITPSNASRDYPFIESGLSEEDYAELVETRGCGEIVHFEETA
jgi:hypothetical protein